MFPVAELRGNIFERKVRQFLSVRDEGDHGDGWNEAMDDDAYKSISLLVDMLFKPIVDCFLVAVEPANIESNCFQTLIKCTRTRTYVKVSKVAGDLSKKQPIISINNLYVHTEVQWILYEEISACMSPKDH